MSIRSWFEYVDALPSSIAIRESIYGYPALLTSHVVAMCLFSGLIIMMDLRLVGLAYREIPVSQIQKRLFPWQMFGMALSAMTGSLLFYGQPLRYYGKVYFWTKVVLMILAGANALAFHFTTYRTVATWDRSDVMLPRAAKLAGVFSLALWAGVVLTGRLTAYNWLTYN
jgi:hypothetical protein